MAYKHCCVIDSQGYYIPNAFVQVNSVKGDFSDAVIYAYTLKEGEQLVEAIPPTPGLVRPRWGVDQWLEGATQQELDSVQTKKEEEMQSRIEEIRASKLQAMADDSLQAIATGTAVKTSRGEKHFALTDKDLSALLQLELKGQTGRITEESGVPYHDGDSGDLTIWTLADFQKIVTCLDNHKLYHEAYLGKLNQYIKRCTNAIELEAITYDTPLPDDLQTELDEMLKLAEEA